MVVTLFSSKSFSQTDMIIADDSLVCFPMRYLSFIKEDLMKGDANKKKVQELTESMTVQQNENQSLKLKLKTQFDECSTCRDSLEMKNALITNYHGQIKRGKNRNKLLTGVVVVLTLLFAIK